TSEQVYDQADLLHGIDRLEKLLEKKLATISEETDRQFVQDYFGQVIAQCQAGNPTEDAKLYADLLYQEETTILDYFPTSSLF
ncbi:hypothetical protein DQE84_17850, partial [Staphylococcus warneri]